MCRASTTSTSTHEARIGVDADATRRTRLAAERTYLAWWRSGLTAIAVGLAAGKLVPELSGGASWPYQLLGVGYTVLGVVVVAYAYRRERSVDAALRRGEWAPLDASAAVTLTAVTIVLGAATVAVVLLAGS
jgi:putative membrane protein